MSTQKSGLPSPDIPVAQADGLIRISDLVNDVEIFIASWSGAQPMDAYQLMLNAAPVGDKQALPNPVPEEGSRLRLTVPLESLGQDGLYSVGYRIVSHPGGGSTDSAVTIIQIDRTPPGGPLMGPVLFPGAFLDSLKVQIPTYVGMEPGDLIQTLCNNTEGPTFLVQADNLTTTPIEIPFTKDFLESLQSDKVTLTYHVTDRAGNRSILAQSVDLTLAL